MCKWLDMTEAPKSPWSEKIKEMLCKYYFVFCTCSVVCLAMFSLRVDLVENLGSVPVK